MTIKRTKVESDRLGCLKISYEKQVNEFSRGLSRGAAVCTLYTSATISKRPFHELEFLVGGGGCVNLF